MVFHHLQAKHLVGVFQNDSLRTLSIGPQAEAINFRMDENDQPSGAVKMSADRINFLFEKDELRRLAAIRGTEGTYYSEDLMPEELRLEGFAWLPARRPTKTDVLGGVIIPDPESAGLIRDEVALR
jgi:hypothetical protein